MYLFKCENFDGSSELIRYCRSLFTVECRTMWSLHGRKQNYAFIPNLILGAYYFC